MARRSAVVLTILVLGCQQLGGLMRLQQDLSRAYSGAQIHVNVTNDRLTVSFVNYRMSDADSADAAAFAREVAEFVRDHYVGYDRIQVVAVGFSSVKGAGPITITNNRVPYAFRTRELGPPVRPDSLRDSAAQRIS